MISCKSIRQWSHPISNTTSQRKHGTSLDTWKKVKWVVFIDGKVIMIKKGAMLWCIDYETVCMTIWNCHVSLRTNGGTPSQIAHPRENMGQVLGTMWKKGKWVVFRDSKVIIIKNGTMLRCTAYETLCMTIWNCNVSLRTNGGTHQCIGSELHNVQWYWWDSVCRSQPQTPRSTRGFQGLHVLFKKELRNRVHLVHKDVDAHYMWIWI